MDSIKMIIDEYSALNDKDLRKKIVKRMRKAGYKKKDYGWYISFPIYLDILRQDYTSTFEELDMPSLCIYGQNDKYVNPSENISKLKKMDNPFLEIKEFKGVNHYLSTGELSSASVNRYFIDREVSKFIMDWILNE